MSFSKFAIRQMKILNTGVWNSCVYCLLFAVTDYLVRAKRNFEYHWNKSKMVSIYKYIQIAILTQFVWHNISFVDVAANLNYRWKSVHTNVQLELHNCLPDVLRFVEATSCFVSSQLGNIQKNSLADYDLIRTIGTGSFGRVLLARRRFSARSRCEGNDMYAIKVLDKQQVGSSWQLDDCCVDFQKGGFTLV